MFWAVGPEIDVPQTNPTTRDRLPFSVKREMLVVVHHRRQHSVCGYAFWLAGDCQACGTPYSLHRILPDTISFKPAAEMSLLLVLLVLLLRRKHPMCPGLGLSGTAATGAT